jgi:hypothetical protein
VGRYLQEVDDPDIQHVDFVPAAVHQRLCGVVVRAGDLQRVVRGGERQLVVADHERVVHESLLR